MSFAAVREPAHACVGLETPGPIRKRPLSAEFPPVPPWPAGVAVPLLALERRYPSSCAWSFRLRSSARSSSPMERAETLFLVGGFFRTRREAGLTYRSQGGAKFARQSNPLAQGINIIGRMTYN